MTKTVLQLELLRAVSCGNKVSYKELEGKCRELKIMGSVNGIKRGYPVR